MTTDRRDAASPARAGGVARNQPRKETSVLLIATQDQALHAIRAHVDRPGVDPTLTALVNGVLAVHRIDPPEDAGKPWADCADCGGSGVVVHISEDGVATRHCHCQCPWCAGCDEALCGGPCPTVAAMARALNLLPSPDCQEGTNRD